MGSWIACFHLGDLAFGSGPFAVAVTELWRRSGGSGSREDVLVGADLNDAALDAFGAFLMQRTCRTDRGREPDLDPLAIVPDRDGHGVSVWAVIVAVSRSIEKSALLNNPFGDDAGGAGATSSTPAWPSVLRVVTDP